MASTLVHCTARHFCFPSSMQSIGRISLEKNRTVFSEKRFPDLVCHCAQEDNDVASPNNNPSVGRREALVSIVTGVSVASASCGFRELFNNETEQGALGLEDAEIALFSDEVAITTGITSEYIRPGGASPDLPLHTLLPTSQKFSGNGKFAAQDPSQVYISLYGPNHMQVSWITSGKGASTVDWGTSKGVYENTATGSSSSYTYGSYTSGNIHYVTIGPLPSDTTYFYRVGGVKPDFEFKTPPPAGPDVPILFAVVGDLGQTSNSQSTLDHIQKSSYDVLILPGDLSYADGDQPRWDSYGNLVSPLASSRPWMVTQGNHEIESAFGVQDFTAYNARWTMPYALSGSDSNLFYSFEVAGVHFLMLGSYADYSQGSDQYKWLQNDLAKVDRLKTPWLIGVIHAPWYNSNYAHQGDGDGMLQAMEDLLFGAKVDIIFAGHVHAYERAVRTYQGQPNDCGIAYINIGDGGNREGLAKRYMPTQPVWSAFREASFGHGELSINNATTAVWTWHRNHDDEAVIADSVVITSLSASGKC